MSRSLPNRFNCPTEFALTVLGGKWKTIWDDATLPTVVQIQIVALSANHHFPVIQAPTMLDTNGSF